MNRTYLLKSETQIFEALPETHSISTISSSYYSKQNTYYVQSFHSGLKCCFKLKFYLLLIILQSPRIKLVSNTLCFW